MDAPISQSVKIKGKNFFKDIFYKNVCYIELTHLRQFGLYLNAIW